MGRSKFEKGSRNMKDRHEETCRCRRCRARVEALERRPAKIRPDDYHRYMSHITEDED